nr:hypothetical protein [Rhodococcus sp. (in: high G+C Gram-positive bacteria)]
MNTDTRERFARAEIASIPVRSRSRTASVDVGCAFFAAATVTGGTVLLSNLPEQIPVGAAIFLEVLAEMGAYVVDAPDGMSVTTRSTAGELRGVDADVSGCPELVPLLLVAASIARSPSVFRGVPAAPPVVHLLRAAGADVDHSDSRVRMTPAPLHGIRWDAPSSAGAFAGLLLGLAVEQMVVDVSPVDREHPGALAEWTRILHADEYLLPGSARLPHDFLRGPAREKAPHDNRSGGRE